MIPSYSISINHSEKNRQKLIESRTMNSIFDLIMRISAIFGYIEELLEMVIRREERKKD